MHSVLSLVPPEARTIRIRGITRRAEKLFKRMAPVHQAEIRRVMRQPILAKDCHLLCGHEQVKLRRFGAADYLRITIRRIQGLYCVLHVGTHESGDKFARHYDGQIPRRILPIKESVIMKDNKQSSNGKGIPQGARGSVAAPVADVPLRSDEGSVVFKAVEVVAGKIVEEETKKLRDNHDALESLLLGQSSLLGNLADRLDALGVAIAGVDTVRSQVCQLETASLERDAQVEKVNECVHAVCREATASMEALNEKVRRLDSSFGEMLRVCDRFSKEVESRLGHLSESLRAMESSLGSPDGIEHRLGALEGVCSHQSSVATALQSHLNQLADGLTRVECGLATEVKIRERSGLFAKLASIFRGLLPA